MYYDINSIIRKELEDIKRIVAGIELSRKNEGKRSGGEAADKSNNRAESLLSEVHLKVSYTIDNL